VHGSGTTASSTTAAAQDRFGVVMSSGTHNGDWPMLMKLPVQVFTTAGKLVAERTH
jgi:hypothetical protein